MDYCDDSANTVPVADTSNKSAYVVYLLILIRGVSTPGPTRACTLVNLTCALINS